MPEALAITWRGVDHRWRRLRFVPTADGVDRVEEEWNGCTWRPVGREPVSAAAIEAGDREVVFA